jgi:hypothetical protein
MLAFQTYGESSSGKIVYVTQLPDCATTREFKLPANNYNSAGGGELAISPDRKKVAVLVPLHEMRFPLSDSSYRVPGRSCLLVVYDLVSGTNATCKRRVLRGICWSPDSAQVYFHSLSDEQVLSREIAPKGWQKQFDFDDREQNEFFRPPLFSYRLSDGQVSLVAQRAGELVRAHQHAILLSSNDCLVTLSLTNGPHRQLQLGTFDHHRGSVISPDGNFAVASFRLNPFTSYLGYPSIVDLRNPKNRFYLGRVMYRVDWTTVHEAHGNPQVRGIE